MYRATAEIVSGSKVFAGGKWLKCIGNKRVSVGERIWTDGRCVYGHFQETQQPLVITGGGDGDKAIPILISENDDDAYKFYTFHKNKIVELPAPENFDATGYWALINNKKVTYINSKSSVLTKYVPGIWGPAPPGSHTTRPHLAPASWFYKRTLAVNTDEKGNTFEIERNSEAYGGYDDFGGIRYFCTVHIKKNGLILKTFNYREKLEQLAAQVASSLQTPQPNEWYTFVLWGVIENENSWAFTVGLYAFYTEIVTSFSPPGNSDLIYYLCTPKGEVQFSVEQPPTNEQIPIQDGYFFKINSLISHPTYYKKAPRYMNVSIYTPRNQMLYTGEFSVGTYFTICKYKSSFLLGLDDQGGGGLGGFSTLFSPNYIKNKVGNGIFHINVKEQKLELLVEGKVDNWKLRPIKHYRNWHERIQEIKLIETA